MDQAASEWIKTHVHLDQPALEATLEDYLYELEHVAVQKAPAEIKTAYRDAASVVTIVSELGWLSCFQGPRQLMGYSGLVAREHSNGNRIQRGSIAKIGNAHLRRVLVEAASAYQHRSNVTGYLLRRQKSLAARGKNKNQS